MRTRRSPRNQESMLRIVSGIKDKQALIMNNAKQRERIAELEAERDALQAQVVALKADNDVFSRYVRDNMALVAHDDRCVVCERGGKCSEREALEKDDWKSFGEVMQIYQRRSAQTQAQEVKA